MPKSTHDEPAGPTQPTEPTAPVEEDLPVDEDLTVPQKSGPQPTGGFIRPV